MTPATWLWIPVTIGAALAQTFRNAAQRYLTASLGTLGATLVRFLYGLPFAALWFAFVRGAGTGPLPRPAPDSSGGCCSAPCARSWRPRSFSA